MHVCVRLQHLHLRRLCIFLDDKLLNSLVESEHNQLVHALQFNG
jgi:hypothetical protein